MKGKTRQPYPRESNSSLASFSLFPKHASPLSAADLQEAIERAYLRALKNKKGDLLAVPSTPEKLVNECIRHLKKRSDPILTPYFYSQCKASEIFELDATSHEMQRQRMRIGVFYQFLIIELMRIVILTKNSNIEAVFDGPRAGDVLADIKTPGFAKGLRLYISVKKSSDTVGGQDVSGAIKRLEDVAKAEKNLTRPYLCVFCYATPPGGKVKGYEESRGIRYAQSGFPYSENCESWEPGFIFPYICGRPPSEVYRQAIVQVSKHLPFYSLQFKQECSKLLVEKLKQLDLLDSPDKLSQEKFVKFISQ